MTDYFKITNRKLGIALATVFLFLPTIVSAATLIKAPSNLGLVGYWSMNEGTSTVVTDFSGNGNNGSMSNFSNPPSSTSGWVNGKFGKALNFDASDDTVVVNDSTKFNDMGAVTIAAWIYPRTLGEGANLGRILDKADSGTPTLGWSLLLSNSSANSVVFTVDYDGAANLARRTTANVIDLNQWQFIAVTWDGSATAANALIYKNGVEVSAYDLTTNGTGNRVSDVGELIRIGSEQGGTRTFDGVIDEARIYNRVLSPTEVASLYQSSRAQFINSSSNSRLTNGLVGLWSFNGADIDWATGKAYDRSGSNNGNLISMSTTSSPVVGRVGQALVFDGGTDFIQLQDSSVFDPGGAASWCLWFYNNTTQSGKPLFMHDVSSGKTTSSYKWIAAYISSNGANLSGFVRIGGTPYNATAVGTFNNGWYHVCTTFDRTLGSGRLKIYVDGEFGGETDAADGNIDAGADPEIGRWDGNNSYYKGIIDEVRMYNRALRPEEVKALYNTAGGTINSSRNNRITDGLIGLWSFNGADMNWETGKAVDQSGQANNGNFGPGISTSTSPTKGRIGQALSFFNPQRIHVPPIAQIGANSVTVSAWVKLLSSGGSSYGGTGGLVFYSRFPSNRVSPTFAITTAGGGGNKGLFFFCDTDFVGLGAKGASTINVGEWYHVVGRFERTGSGTYGGTWDVYLNGVKDNATSNNVDLNPGPNCTASNFNSDNWYIGNFEGGGGADMVVDELRVYNRALDTTEIRQLYLMGK